MKESSHKVKKHTILECIKACETLLLLFFHGETSICVSLNTDLNFLLFWKSTGYKITQPRIFGEDSLVSEISNTSREGGMVVFFETQETEVQDFMLKWSEKHLLITTVFMG